LTNLQRVKDWSAMEAYARQERLAKARDMEPVDYRLARGDAEVVAGQMADSAGDIGAPTARIRANQSPLDYYWSRKKIGEREYAAGCTLRRDHGAAGLSARMIATLDTAGRAPGFAPRVSTSEYALDAEQRYTDAMRGLTDRAGYRLSMLVRTVCVEDTGPADAYLSSGRPRRDGKGNQIAGLELLCAGLNILANIYKMPENKG
jgi:hypothetical protein